MDILDFIIQNLSIVFAVLIIVWAFASFSELKVRNYFYQALIFINKFICSEETYDVKSLPEYVVTQGFFMGRKAIVRLNIASPRYLRYRIYAHLSIQSRGADVVFRKSNLHHPNATQTIIWNCSLFTPPVFSEVHAVFRDLVLEVENIEAKNNC